MAINLLATLRISSRVSQAKMFEAERAGDYEMAKALQLELNTLAAAMFSIARPDQPIPDCLLTDLNTQLTGLPSIRIH